MVATSMPEKMRVLPGVWNIDQEWQGFPTACTVAEFTSNVDIPVSSSWKDSRHGVRDLFAPGPKGYMCLKNQGTQKKMTDTT